MNTHKDKGEKWTCGYCGQSGINRTFMEKHKCPNKSMTTSSKTNKELDIWKKI